MIKFLVIFWMVLMSIPTASLASDMTRDALFDYIAEQEKANDSLAHCADVASVDMVRLLCFVTESGEIELCSHIRTMVGDDKYRKQMLDMTYICVRAGILRNQVLPEKMCDMLEDADFPYFKEYCDALQQGTIEGCESMLSLVQRPAPSKGQNQRDALECMLHHAQRLQDFDFCVAAQQMFDDNSDNNALRINEGFLGQCPASYKDFWKNTSQRKKAAPSNDQPVSEE